MGQHNDPTNVLLVLAGPFAQRRGYDPRSCESAILCSSDPMISPNGQDVEVVEQELGSPNPLLCHLDPEDSVSVKVALHGHGVVAWEQLQHTSTPASVVSTGNRRSKVKHM